MLNIKNNVPKILTVFLISLISLDEYLLKIRNPHIKSQVGSIGMIRKKSDQPGQIFTHLIQKDFHLLSVLILIRFHSVALRIILALIPVRGDLDINPNNVKH